MLPNVFQILNVPTIAQHVGASPVRIFDFGIAPADVLRPYIVFSQVAGSPYANVSDAPNFDFDVVQIDIYADDRAKTRELAKAVQVTLDAAGVANRLSMQNYEPETKLYRITFDADFISQRDNI